MDMSMRCQHQNPICNGHNEESKAKIALPSPEETRQIKRTPYRHLSIPTLSNTMEKFKEIVDSAALISTKGTVQPLVALSIKTQPDLVVLQEALKCGYVSEAISMDEYDLALKSGFSPDQIILNGPAKFWRENGPQETPESCLAIFADSVAEFEDLCDQSLNKGTVLGIRLAMPGTNTRFGIDISDRSAMERVMECLQSLPDGQEIGFHFHFASSKIGLEKWFDLCHTYISTCRSIAVSCPHLMVSVLDFGGGYSPDITTSNSMRQEFQTGLEKLFLAVTEELGTVRRVVLEPGKAITQNAVTLITRVLAIREPIMRQNQDGRPKARDERSIIVDACLGELPLILINIHPSDVYFLSASGRKCTWNLIPNGGNDMILGRICMEQDVMASGKELPIDLKVGDYLAMVNVGAYNTSMALSFGCGRQYGTDNDRGFSGKMIDDQMMMTDEP